MSVITYYAKNRASALVSGHSQGTQYQIEFNAIYPKRYQENKIVRSAISGEQEEILRHVKAFYDIEVRSLVNATAFLNWQEFFTSVCSREIFQFDPTGTIASPGTDINVALVGSIPEPGLLDPAKLYRPRFTVEVV